MTWELHVWGPAFSLPSIDPPCLAAIAYLTQALPPDHWVLVPHARWGPRSKRDLPLLWDSTQWIGGFHRIVDRVHETQLANQSSWALDRLAPPDNADVVAFSSLIESSGQNLLDLSLYVSTENFTRVTRPAYSRILTWPDQWFVPSARRAVAKARVEHLNLSALDTDSNKNDNINGNSESVHGKSATDFIPETLRSSRKSVSEIVRQPHVAARIRLDGMADALLRPLDQLLGNKRYLLSETSPSSLDCLAVAYLALALIPVLPERWLAESMLRYPRLCAYVHELNQRFFGGPTDVDGAIPTTWSGDAAGSQLDRKQESQNDRALPWKESRQEALISPTSAAAVLLENTLISVPGLGERWKKRIIPPSSTGESHEFKADTRPTDGIFGSDANFQIRSGVVAAGTAVVALASYLFYLHPAFLSSSSADEPRPRRATQSSDIGEAGDFLAKAGLGGDEHGSQQLEGVSMTQFIVA